MQFGEHFARVKSCIGSLPSTGAEVWGQLQITNWSKLFIQYLKLKIVFLNSLKNFGMVLFIEKSDKLTPSHDAEPIFKLKSEELLKCMLFKIII